MPFGHNKRFLNQGLSAAVLGGFQISGIFSFQSGRPFTVFNSSSNNSGFYGNNDRPNQVGDPNSAVNPATNAPTHTVSQWFNTAAFVSAPSFQVINGVVTRAGQFGNAARNNIIGPKYTDLDLTLSRNFPIFERVSGQLRAESFNLLNHPNFLNPLSNGVQYGTSTFGTITLAQNPRDLQFSLRILF